MQEEPNATGQERFLNEDQVKMIIRLLESTPLTMAEIAAAMGCTKRAVATINRRNVIRWKDGELFRGKLAG